MQAADNERLLMMAFIVHRCKMTKLRTMAAGSGWVRRRCWGQSLGECWLEEGKKERGDKERVTSVPRIGMVVGKAFIVFFLFYTRKPRDTLRSRR